MAIYIDFVTAPYAAPGIKMAMLFFYCGLQWREVLTMKIGLLIVRSRCKSIKAGSYEAWEC